MSTASTRPRLRDSNFLLWRAPIFCDRQLAETNPVARFPSALLDQTRTVSAISSVYSHLRPLNYNFLPMSPQSAASSSQQSQNPSVAPPPQNGKRPRLFSEA